MTETVRGSQVSGKRLSAFAIAEWHPEGAGELAKESNSLVRCRSGNSPIQPTPGTPPGPTGGK